MSKHWLENINKNEFIKINKSIKSHKSLENKAKRNGDNVKAKYHENCAYEIMTCGNKLTKEKKKEIYKICKSIYGYNKK